MKTIFIVNPAAGQGHGIAKLRDEIERVSKEVGIEAGFYLTKAIGDAEVFAGLAIKEAEAIGEELRLIACGGDGTVNEVVNACVGHDSVSFGVLPIGTGNDYVRNFPEAGDFMSIEAQLKGETIKTDIMKYTGVIEGKEQTRYCANMFNIGFDCNVVDLTAVLKTYPLLSGSMAYLAAVMGVLIKKKGASLKVEMNGEELSNGPILLCAIANGSFCGGGIKSSPVASIHDGILDINIVKNVSRATFIRLFPKYSKGTHLEIKNLEKLYTFKQNKTVTITPLEGTMRVCVDGEIVNTEKIDIEVMPDAANVIVPKVL